MTANDMRGEVIAVIGDNSYTLRYTTGALRKLERATGLTIPRIIGRVQGGDFGYDLTLSALEIGLTPDDLAVIGKTQGLEDVLSPRDIPRVMKSVVRALILALSGPEGLAKADTAMAEKKPAFVDTATAEKKPASVDTATAEESSTGNA